MKILTIAKYIYVKGIPAFEKNKTGYGMMVRDIMAHVAKNDDISSYLYTNVITKKKNILGIHILSHTLMQIIRYASLKDWFNGFGALVHSKGSFVEKIKQAYFAIDMGCFRKILDDIQPDIVHIHGISSRTELFMKTLDEKKYRYCFTLHALIGLTDTIEGSLEEAKYEQEFLQKASNRLIPVSLISTGMYKRIEKQYKIKNRSNFAIIKNGTDFNEINIIPDVDILKKFSLPKNKKLLLAIGNICNRKNQIIIPDIIQQLNEEDKKQVLVIIAGRDFLNGELEKKIYSYGLSEQIKCIGFVDKEDLVQLQNIAFGNIVVSIDEAFGLSIIEGFSFGIPTIMFGDLDASLDVYSSDACCLVGTRDTKEYASALTHFIKKEWDKESIIKHSLNFTSNMMANEYVEYYRKILQVKN